jgi:hypothetical protein
MLIKKEREEPKKNLSLASWHNENCLGEEAAWLDSF